MPILAMSILIASHAITAITMINTIIDGTIMAIGITIMGMDDRWIDGEKHHNTYTQLCAIDWSNA
jgi:VCBS repeat-containing protein